MGGYNTYMQQCQRFLRDARQEKINADDMLNYVNRARREVAERTQCVRRLTPIAGSVMGGSVVTGGTGYTNPTLVISPPDFPPGTPVYPNGAQAVGAVTQVGGVLNGCNISFGGAGYFNPVATVTDPTGTGALVSLQLSPINQLNPGQESYNFSDIDVSVFPGVDSVYAIMSVAVIYANYRYALPMYDFSTYQAKIRQYPFQYQYVPAFCSQYGQGNGGSFYAYPLPSQIYQWEFDSLCVPQDLLNDQSVDVIPKPWDDIVPMYAAHLAYLELQNWNAAEYYLNLFDKMTLRKSQYARVSRAVNKYGRY
jgi:hypothetical protein